jgi:hypothetical protein
LGRRLLVVCAPLDRTGVQYLALTAGDLTARDLTAESARVLCARKVTLILALALAVAGAGELVLGHGGRAVQPDGRCVDCMLRAAGLGGARGQLPVTGVG